MKIYSVYDAEFRPYGRIVEGLNNEELLGVMKSVPLPETGKTYQASIESFENCAVFEDYQNSLFGGMPTQLGMCWGRNTVLNALEYHRDSEFNLGTDDYILLLAKLDEVEDFMLDTAKIKAFKVPAGVLVEIYASTLHYAPCHVNEEAGFRTLVALPRGTNTERPATSGKCKDDKYMPMKNKWLLAHPDSPEAINKGRAVGLKGVNIDIAADL